MLVSYNAPPPPTHKKRMFIVILSSDNACFMAAVVVMQSFNMLLESRVVILETKLFKALLLKPGVCV